MKWFENFMENLGEQAENYESFIIPFCFFVLMVTVLGLATYGLLSNLWIN